MFDSGDSYHHLQRVLDGDDIAYLKEACKQNLADEKIPCFSLIDRLGSKVVGKIKTALEQWIGEELFYLNDFYIYTDRLFKTAWHMDTELFSFDRAVNAWILLSPDEVSDPLCFIDEINKTPENFFHSVSLAQGELTFSEYHSRRKMTRSASEIEATQIHTPVIHKGDILAINPGHFHRTNVNSQKHAISIKFLLRGVDGFLSKKQVHPILWAEVKTFNKLVKGTADWGEVVDNIRLALKTDEGRKTLSSGFYPDQFDRYMEQVRSI